jgi:hypothetical protein
MLASTIRSVPVFITWVSRKLMETQLKPCPSPGNFFRILKAASYPVVAPP